MYKEQAIEIIERHIDNNIAPGSLVEQALRMAIEALKQPKIVRCRECAVCRPFLSSKVCSFGLLPIINPDIDFCSRAVRSKTDDQR